jgi:hypothetical protein
VSPALLEIARNAQEAARRLDHSWIGAEHLLFATCAAEDHTGQILRAAGLMPRAVWDDLRVVVGLGRWAVDRDALAECGIDLDTVLDATAASGANRVPARRRRRKGHLPPNAVARRCLVTAQSLDMDAAPARLAYTVINAGSRTVDHLLRRADVPVAQLSRRLHDAA